MSLRRFAGPALAVLAAVPACTCGEGEVVERLVPRIALSAQALDFGEVPIGFKKRLALSIANPGGTALTLGGVTASGPFAVDAPAFSVPAGGSLVIDVSFAPVDAGPAQGSLQIASDAEETPNLAVSLAGVGVPGFVDVTPTRVDFSQTRVGTARSAELRVENRGLEAVGGPVSPLRFARPDAFTLAGTNLSRPGRFSVEARGTSVMTLDYNPFVVGDDSGRVIFELCGPGCGLEVEVVASAVSSSIRVEPAAVDFGAVGIGETKTEIVTVHNDGDGPIDVGRARTLGSSETGVTSARSLPATLEPGGTLVLTVSYAPSAATEMVGQLSVETSDEGVPEARVRLTGHGAGPLFEVSPDHLDFGVVRRTSPQRRSFLLLNAGSADVRVTGLRYAGHPSMRLVNTPGLPARLGPGETLTPSVELVPTGTAGRYLGEVVIESDDAAHAEVHIPVTAAFSETACQLDIAPERLNFGLVTPPHAREQSVRVVNSGDRPCVVERGDFAPPLEPAFTLTSSSFPVRLDPSQAVELPFRYAPTDLAEAKASFVLSTDDAEFPERQISLVGSSKSYDDVFVVPTALDFGRLEPMCLSGERRVRAFNAGTIDAYLESVRVIGSSELRQRQLTTPFLLRAGASADLLYTYAPNDLGVDRGEIEVAVRNKPFPLIVSWVGEGVTIAELTEQFEQPRARPVDVLFVIDDSCSMQDEQNALTANFANFIQTANVRAVDFRLAITTTDVTGNLAGALKGPVMKPNTPALEQEFQRQAAVGTQGSGFEQGLEAMHQAFRRHPADFLRPNVTLVVVIISDEDDGSPGSPVTYLNSLRSVNSDFFVAVISGQNGGCFAPTTGQAIPAPVYESFVALTQGLSISICAPWSGTLANLGAAVFGLKTSFALQNAIDRSQPVVVKVNGAVVPAASWSYDAPTKSIVFAPSAIPPEGATIEVTYSPGC